MVAELLKVFVVEIDLWGLDRIVERRVQAAEWIGNAFGLVGLFAWKSFGDLMETFRRRPTSIPTWHWTSGCGRLALSDRRKLASRGICRAPRSETCQGRPPRMPFEACGSGRENERWVAEDGRAWGELLEMAWKSEHCRSRFSELSSLIRSNGLDSTKGRNHTTWWSRWNWITRLKLVSIETHPASLWIVKRFIAILDKTWSTNHFELCLASGW